MADSIAVAALSARMLAESARRGGFATIALDVFGDADTRRAAGAWASIGAAASLRLDADRVAQALVACARSPNFIGWVAGAGFEAVPDALARGAGIARLIGNPPHVIDAIRLPRDFFRRLSGLGIRHPVVAWEAPVDRDGWLRKDARGSGGWHIRPARAGDRARRTVDAHAYYQRVHAGMPMSVLFIADGTSARIVGINELIVRARGARPCVYHGAIGPVAPSERVLRDIRACVESIVREWGLVGLNGVDFLLDEERIVVLEVNARPTATIGLYEEAFPDGAMRAHVEACVKGSLPAEPAVLSTRRLRGHSIVFAVDAVSAFERPTCERMLSLAFAHDVPSPGTSIPKGAPLCSVSAEGLSAAEVREALDARTRQMLAMVAGTSRASHGKHT
jgi:predicted ATP-grasp superfamily ATP-dependent carboligase